MWSSRAPEFSRHCCANDFTSSTVFAHSASSSGEVSVAKYSSVCCVEPHTTGVDCPLPRGSQPMTSWPGKSDGSIDVTMSWPEPPGPPGFTNKVAARFSAAGAFFIFSVIAWPSGWSQSRGTRTVPHWKPPQAVQLIFWSR